MFQAAFECFPWDLDLEGYDDALGRLAGDIGVDAVLVTAVHQGIRELRQRAPEAERAFICGAAAHFQPDSRKYAGLRIRPLPAAWMKSRNPLERITEAAEKHRLKLRVSVSCCQGDALVERYRHAACIDFFGTAMNWLCPSHPDVRSYLAALVEDLTTNYPVAALHLDTAHFEPFYATGYMDSLEPPPEISSLFFNTCYCAACCQRATDAGVDVSALRAVIDKLLVKLNRWELVAASSLTDLSAQEPLIAAFQRMRRETVTSLVHSLKTCCRTALRIGLFFPSETSAAVPAELSAHCDGFYVQVSSSRERDWPSDEIEDAGGPARCDINFTCYPPMAPDSPTLVSAVHRAAQSGIGSIIFTNYGVTPEPCLDWVRQAIRYARREAP